MPTSLKYRTLSAAIGDRIRQDILAGVHPSGAQLRQDALAETYGVSRIPVREALFQLESEGLILMVPHKGAVVSEWSIDEVNDVFDLRALLEPRLLEDSAPKLTTDDFAQTRCHSGGFLRRDRLAQYRAMGTAQCRSPHGALHAREPAAHDVDRRRPCCKPATAIRACNSRRRRRCSARNASMRS